MLCMLGLLLGLERSSKPVSAPSTETLEAGGCRCRHMAYVSLVLDDHDEAEPAGSSDEGHYRCLSCALADASCGPSAVVMVRADLDELEACAQEFEGASFEPPGQHACLQAAQPRAPRASFLVFQPLYQA